MTKFYPKLIVEIQLENIFPYKGLGKQTGLTNVHDFYSGSQEICNGHNIYLPEVCSTITRKC